ncbi:MAG: T9SS type A sorting domain-containing protein [Candidatus Cloacimonetes bacterium]|nr:T9SS type A sorting domain-containing protein [Candidatus Cloacimonadota bacterium]
MTKCRIIVLMLLCFGMLTAFEVMPQDARCLPEHPVKLTLLDYENVPQWTFCAPLDELIFTYYDYMPGGYRNIPLQVQSNGGVYMVMQAQSENQSRNVYYNYCNANGELSGSSQIPVSNSSQGFIACDLDFELDNPFFAWHVDQDGDGTFEVMMAYDNWSLLQSPGYPSAEFMVWDSGDWSGTGFTPPIAGDDFVWPFVFISEAPTYEIDLRRRIYIFGRNKSDHVGGSHTNILYAYADFDYHANGFYNMGPWTYNTIPLLDDWSQGIPESIYMYKSIAVEPDGKIAMMGFTGINDYNNPDLLMLWNDNYGEGNWTQTYVNSRQWVDDPIYHGSEYYFGDTIPEDSLHFRFMGQAGLMNLSFDGLGRVHFAVPMTLCDTADSEGTYSFYFYMQFMKDVIYDPITDSFTITDLDPKGVYPSDGELYIPWDVDADGVTDVNAGDTLVMETACYPYFYFEQNNGNFRICANKENGWMAAVWQSGLKAYYANEGLAGWDDWVAKPEICVAISNDNGDTWSDPVMMNANVTPELANMIPEYIYPAEKIIDLGGDWGMLHFYFLNDNTYGSQQPDPHNGGNIIHSAIRLNFDESSWTTQEDAVGIMDNDIPLPPQIIAKNYPNPFNPETTIEFSLPTATDVTVEVYNLKGQKVCQLLNENCLAGRNSIVWNGTNSDGNGVASGIYMYKVSTGETIVSGKMLLLK